MDRTELTIGALGGLLAAAVIGFLVWQASTTVPRPADLEVQIVGMTQANSNYRVEVRVRNIGGRTAAGAVVQGSLADGGTTVETSHVTLDYVPADSVVRATLLFSRDPRPLALRVRPVSYHSP